LFSNFQRFHLFSFNTFINKANKKKMFRSLWTAFLLFSSHVFGTDDCGYAVNDGQIWAVNECNGASYSSSLSVSFQYRCDGSTLYFDYWNNSAECDGTADYSVDYSSEVDSYNCDYTGTGDSCTVIYTSYLGSSSGGWGNYNYTWGNGNWSSTWNNYTWSTTWSNSSTWWWNNGTWGTWNLNNTWNSSSPWWSWNFTSGTTWWTSTDDNSCDISDYNLTNFIWSRLAMATGVCFYGNGTYAQLSCEGDAVNTWYFDDMECSGCPYSYSSINDTCLNFFGLVAIIDIEECNGDSYSMTDCETDDSGTETEMPVSTEDGSGSGGSGGENSSGTLATDFALLAAVSVAVLRALWQ
jgi:hypothetical protein